MHQNFSPELRSAIRIHGMKRTMIRRRKKAIEDLLIEIGKLERFNPKKRNGNRED